MIILLLALAGAPLVFGRVLINEIVTDPQRDWSDSAGGDGVSFNDRPGTGTLSATDEWLELVNVSRTPLDLTSWTLVMIDTTPASETLGASGATLRFARGGRLGAVLPGEHVVVGNPAGSLNNAIWIRLVDRAGQVVDEVELGRGDFRGDGLGDEAPDGNATGVADEAVARLPEARDTDRDAADFAHRPATIGRANDSTRIGRWPLYR